MDAGGSKFSEDAIVDMDLSSAYDPDAIAPGVEAHKVKADDVDDVGGTGSDGDPIAEGDEDARLDADGLNGDRLGDRDGAKPARIQDVDLAGRGGLRDRAGERLAGSGTAARVGVVADPGDKGSRRLCARR